MPIKNIDFYGLKLSIFKKDDLKLQIIETIDNNRKMVCFGYSFTYIPWFKNFPYLYEYANNYDLMVTDGRQFYLFAKMLGAPLKFDISIPFLSKLILEIANEKKYSLMIIGSDEKTNRAATENVKKNYPNAIVYDGYTGGDFSDEAQRITVNKINQNSPDIIFIGASSPKKEIFATKWKSSLETKIIVPFGGMIDGLAGKVWLTPPLLKKLGLASFIRVIQEPRRLLFLNIWLFYEIIFKIIPISIYQIKLKKNRNFFIPSIYRLSKNNKILE